MASTGGVPSKWCSLNSAAAPAAWAASRSRAASRVKSLSEDTRQNPSTRPEYKMSIASMIMAESVEFFPVV